MTPRSLTLRATGVLTTAAAVATLAGAAPGIAATGGAGLAGTMTATPSLLASCGYLHRTTVLVSEHDTACGPAKSVAQAYLNGNIHPSGFNCRRFTIMAANGWYARCTKRSAIVEITPE